MNYRLNPPIKWSQWLLSEKNIKPIDNKNKVQNTETVWHITSECTSIAQKDYKMPHDNIASIVHWELCKTYGLEREPRLNCLTLVGLNMASLDGHNTNEWINTWNNQARSGWLF